MFFLSIYFLAHQSHRLKVRFCDRPVSSIHQFVIFALKISSNDGGISQKVFFIKIVNIVRIPKNGC